MKILSDQSHQQPNVMHITQQTCLPDSPPTKQILRIFLFKFKVIYMSGEIEIAASIGKWVRGLVTPAIHHRHRTIIIDTVSHHHYQRHSKDESVRASDRLTAKLSYSQ